MMTNLIALLAAIVLLCIAVYSLVSYLKDQRRAKGSFKR
ncbi:small membrane protein [Klebsiella quasipneumoniae]